MYTHDLNFSQDKKEFNIVSLSPKESHHPQVLSILQVTCAHLSIQLYFFSTFIFKL